jgi:hypothetical protein
VLGMRPSSSAGWGWVVLGGVALVGVALVSSESRERERRAKQLDREFKGVERMVRGTVGEICQAFGIAPLPVAFVGSGNAASDGVAIHVNVPWFHGLLTRHCDAVACSLSVARWVLAHEVAHHVHRDAQVPRWVRIAAHSMELRADYYAGRALAYFGADIGVLDRVLREIAPVATQSHPAFQARIRASHAGYSDFILERAFEPALLAV